MKKRSLVSALSLIAMLGACSDAAPPQATDPAVEHASNGIPADIADGAVPSFDPVGTGEQASAPEGENALTLTGWRGIRLGEAPGAAANTYGFADDGSYTDTCRIWTSKGSPGMYLIVEQFEVGPPVVARITVSGPEASDVHTTRGITLGSTEADVRAAYAPLGEQPHKYEASPAKNLVWGLEGSQSALRFEIGTDGRVKQLHTGISPTLGYVEGCS